MNVLTEFVTFYTDHPFSFLATVAVLSLFVGSFLNVVIYRLPRMIQRNWSEECRYYLGLAPDETASKVNLAMPFSYCPKCKTSIRPWHNIPLLSYLWLQGKCAYCGSHIPLRYPMVELLTMALSIVVAWKFGVNSLTLAALIFTWISICLTFIDLEYHLLPDQLTLLLLWTGLIFSLFNLFCTPQDAIIGAVGGYVIFALVQGVFYTITRKTGMGQGDFKLLAAFGAFLGWQMLPLIILLSSVSGVIITVIMMIIKNQKKSVPIPFGPYLAIAGWISMLWGNDLMHYYMQTLV